MRIAWFSPIAESQLVRSVSFTRNVLPELPADWQVEIFTSDADWLSLAAELWEPTVCGSAVYPYQRAFLRHTEDPFDLFIYQLEDHPASSFVKAGMGVWPGVVFVHDLNLSRLEKSSISHATTEELLNDKAREEFGANVVSVGDLAARGWSTEIFERLYPLGMSELRKAGVIVAPNERSVDELKQRFPRIPVERCEFPIRLLSPEERVVHRAESRRALGIATEEFVIACAAQSAVEDRAYVALSAVAEQLRTEGARPVRLLWFVVDAVAEQTIQRIVASHPDEQVRERTSVVRVNDGQTLKLLCCSADCLVNLKFDLLRGYTGFVHAALSAAVPLIMSDFGPSGELSAAVHVRVGRGEEQELIQVLEALRTDRKFARSVVLQMEEYCELVHDPRSVAEDIESIAAMHSERLREECQHAESRIRQATESAVQGFVQAMAQMSLPLPGGETIDTESVALKVAKDFAWLR